MRILVVEDDLLTAQVLCAAIEECGHQALVARSLSQATETILSEGISAAILDVNLSDGASFALARALRARYLPFFFATGQLMDDHVGFADIPVVYKPFDRRLLKSAISKLDVSALPSEFLPMSIK